MPEVRQGKKMSVWEKLLSIVILLSIISSFTVSSQDDRRSRRNRIKAAEKVEAVQDTVEMTDSMRAVLDSIKFATDSTARADSIARADSLDLLSKSSLEQPAFSAARDSIIEDFSDGKRMIYYYGDVSVTYGNMKLTADYMEYDMQKQTVFARGTKDSTGTWVGQPTMEEGGKTYTMEEVRYNFETRKARITNMITQESEGILHGKNIKMMPDQSINITKGKYTVCDCEHPHYYLHLTAAKVMTKPSQRTVFGPAYPVIEDVPLFPVVLPFGFIPKRPDRATGFLMPTFGEEASRGFFIRDVGMYFVIGDYFDLSLTGDIFTLGSWAVDVNSRYKVNYKCNGNFALTYSNDQTGERNSPDFFQTKNFAVRWSHSQDSKANPGMSFSASVNFSSPSNNRYNATSVTEALQNQISSSISWSKNWGGKVNLSVNALHSQSSRDSSYSFTLPDVTLSVSRFYPFQRKDRVGKKKFYEEFSLAYNTKIVNKINFKASEFNQPGFWDKMQNGMSHNFQIGLPNFTLFKYINFTPSISYSMNWFFNKTEKVFNPETNSVEDVKGKMFSHFGATHNYSGGLSANTRLYGLFNFGKHHKLQAIRHIITPSISFNFSPEKATHFNGYRTLNYVDTLGVARSLDYNIYSGQVNSPPGRGKTASMSLSIGNNVEAKVRDLQDTTGTGTKKIKLIDNLSLSTGYNFLADSLNMNDISLSLSTSVFGKLGVNASARLSPYAVVPTGERTYATINKFNGSVYGWDKPLRLTSANISLSYSFSGEGKINGNDGSSGSSGEGNTTNYTKVYYHPVTGEYIPGGWLYYTNPNSPWSVNISYSFSYNRSYSTASYQLLTNHRFTQAISLSGNVKITPALAINLTTGFDLMAMKMTTTQLSATYDLHCFNISVSWVPTGTWKSWTFRIAANASALADLLRFKKSNSYWDNF
ncbi:MAG: LPS-assembly protein LptD [Bacteroidetes bacterium]|uniref:LPS-assembly protein LptD n=1 Tax=Candidatus Cryptobacteroides faecigallinarum TaxID=2840763 RepID=A0A9D9IM79_9BACT|nr:LPS-assembly protein LptD [Candidatus Cryptobacteroides faecigallinarum]